MAPFTKKLSRPGGEDEEHDSHHWPRLSVWRLGAVDACLFLATASVTYPLWHLKTIEQASSTRYSPLVPARLLLCGQCSWRSLYHGATFGCVGLLPASFTSLCLYECAKYHLSRAGLQISAAPAVAAAVSEVVWVALATPVEVVTVQRQCSSPLSRALAAATRGTTVVTSVPTALSAAPVPHHGSLVEARSIWEAGGARRLYRGALLSLASSIPESAVWWTLYEHGKKRLRCLQAGEIVTCIGSGVVASFSTTLLMNPVDVIKTRVQVGQSPLSGLSLTSAVFQSSSGREVFGRVVGGAVRSFPSSWQLFTRGLAPRLGIAVISGSSESCTYETAIHFAKIC
eukprot:TRINITY_DN75175_c0_g1_i1.p1 TRINITY_DN75175_c0_g1~~TRINITY_DN75175_c0_g1_i1.p1  ORF type:complete len:353 (+),score=30.72 TRINITY_DN75175_c0_g1_i1:36-1061(+)